MRMMNGEATNWSNAVGLIPTGAFVMTSSHDHNRAGILVSWVQQCAFEPPLIAVAIRKGRPIEPLIRDSHSFALCQIDPDNRLLLARLKNSDEHSSDILDCIECETLSSGAPCITSAIAAIDCEVIRHFDLDADHELYIGQVLAARVYRANGHIPRSVRDSSELPPAV